MNKNLRWKLILIVAVIGLSIWSFCSAAVTAVFFLVTAIRMNTTVRMIGKIATLPSASRPLNT